MTAPVSAGSKIEASGSIRSPAVYHTLEITPCAHTFTGSAVHPLSVYGPADAHFVACGFVPENPVAHVTLTSKSAAFNDVSDPMVYPVVSVGRVHVIAVLDRNFAVAVVPVVVPVAVVPVVDDVVAVTEVGFVDVQRLELSVKKGTYELHVALPHVHGSAVAAVEPSVVEHVPLTLDDAHPADSWSTETRKR